MQIWPQIDIQIDIQQVHITKDVLVRQHGAKRPNKGKKKEKNG